MESFKSEWEESSDRIIWHYWPMEFYKGWDDNRSINTPTREETEDNLFEDISHAGISIRLLSRYFDAIPSGVVSEREYEKIRHNMNYFCFKNGFSRFISGDEKYVPLAWHYGISPYFSWLNNSEYNAYIKQGCLKCFPSWDNQGIMYANAKLYNPELAESNIRVNRKMLSEDGLFVKTEFSMIRSDFFVYLGIE